MLCNYSLRVGPEGVGLLLVEKFIGKSAKRFAKALISFNRHNLPFIIICEAVNRRSKVQIFFAHNRPFCVRGSDVSYFVFELSHGVLVFVSFYELQIFPRFFLRVLQIVRFICDAVSSIPHAIAWGVSKYEVKQVTSINISANLVVKPKYLRFIQSAQNLMYVLFAYCFSVVRFHKIRLTVMR